VAHGMEGIVAIVGFFVFGAYTLTTLARLFVQWRMQARGGGIDPAALEERLTRIEAALENVGAESQRLVEGQRFFADLLTHRSAPPAVAGSRNGDHVERYATPSRSNPGGL
jgi:hypothetical protein